MNRSVHNLWISTCNFYTSVSAKSVAHERLPPGTDDGAWETETHVRVARCVGLPINRCLFWMQINRGNGLPYWTVVKRRKDAIDRHFRFCKLLVEVTVNLYVIQLTVMNIFYNFLRSRVNKMKKCIGTLYKS